MTKVRREQLLRKSGKQIAAMFSTVNKAAPAANIDVTMYWPPDDGVIHFLFGIGVNERDWDFEIPASHWRLPGDHKDEIPVGLAKDLRNLIRTIWKEVARKMPNTQAYLRLHDDAGSTDLRNNRWIWDTERDDYTESDRISFRKPRSAKTNPRRNRELVHRGDSLAKVKQTFGVTADPETVGNVHREATYTWENLGIRIWFKRSKVESVFYSAPFPHKICGVWIGAHAWQVNELLGRAKKESVWQDYTDYKMGGGTKEGFPPSLRIWEYERDGYLWLRFDERDCVTDIGR